jgi:hypothetical protein
MGEIDLLPYAFERGKRSILAISLFPKRVAYQGEVYDTLEAGVHEDSVKGYLHQHVVSIIEEMREYRQVLDPRQYERTRAIQEFVPTIEQANQRIDMYQSHFYGWSMLEVDGMFLGRISGRIDEERTQAIILIFRLESRYEAEAKVSRCYDVLEALMRWVMAESGRLDHVLPWSAREKDRFTRFHGSMPRHKRVFIDRYYVEITKEIKKWIDDTGLFVFAYLNRRFWVNVTESPHQEDEIWTPNFFNMNLNIMRQLIY